MELKRKTGAHHPLKLSTEDEIGKMYTAHYAPSRTVYGRVWTIWTKCMKTLYGLHQKVVQVVQPSL